MERSWRWLLIRLAGACFLATGAFVLALWAEQSSGALVVQVNPETHLSPVSAALSFEVGSPGEVVAARPFSVTAWVRALPGQTIRLTARATSLSGPGGMADSSTLLWTGSMEDASGGASAAACTSGSFDQNPLQQLIAGWSQSGIARCRVTFSLASQSGWLAGTYNAQVDLNLSAR